MKKFLLLLLVVLFVFTACDNSIKPIRFAFGEANSGGAGGGSSGDGGNNNQDPDPQKPGPQGPQEGTDPGGETNPKATPLTIKFTAEGGGTITIENAPSDMKYSRLGSGDVVNKEPIPESGKIEDIKQGEEIQLYANRTEVTSPYLNIKCNEACEVSGDILSLLYGEDFSTKESEELPTNAFSELFKDNTGIVSAKDLHLPSTVAENCYKSMFSGCTSLSKAPELPADTLAKNCYSSMFQDCASLTEAPELKAAELVEGCYQSMFENCTSLNAVTCLATTEPSSTYTGSWLSGIQGPGTFTRKEGVYWPTNTFGRNYGFPKEWEYLPSVTDNPDFSTPLTIKVLNGGGSGVISIYNAPDDMMYSLDDEEKKRPVKSSTIYLDRDGLIIRLYANGTGNEDKGSYPNFFIVCGGECEVYGNIMSLLSENDFKDKKDITTKNAFRELFKNGVKSAENLFLPATTLAEGCYQGMFKDCSNLTIAPKELPATTLAESCYQSMFQGCKITTAPELPATTLAKSCYQSMFQGCTGLTTAPAELSAPTLAESCYQSMFQGCTNLTQAPKLLATNLAKSCYQSMFQECTVLTSAPELPATTLAQGCYSSMFARTGLTQAPTLPAETLEVGCYNGMFASCTSLTQAPKLPATTLATNCYSSMFSGCTNLTSVPKDLLPAGKDGEGSLAQYCYQSMFQGCTGLTTAPELPATTLAKSCYQSMFQGCTNLTQAPELPATTLTEECYWSMFENCTNLTKAPAELPAQSLATRCYADMFKDCSSLNPAPKLPATSLAGSCYQNMFENCTSLTKAPELPATWLSNNCYSEMFTGCTSLTEAELPAKWRSSGCYYAMFEYCANLKSLTCLLSRAPVEAYGDDKDTAMWLFGAGTAVIERGEKPIFYHAEGIVWPYNKSLEDEDGFGWDYGIPDDWDQKNISDK